MQKTFYLSVWRSLGWLLFGVVAIAVVNAMLCIVILGLLKSGLAVPFLLLLLAVELVALLYAVFVLFRQPVIRVDNRGIEVNDVLVLFSRQRKWSAGWQEVSDIFICRVHSRQGKVHYYVKVTYDGEECLIHSSSMIRKGARAVRDELLAAWLDYRIGVSRRIPYGTNAIPHSSWGAQWFDSADDAIGKICAAEAARILRELTGKVCVPA